MAEFDIASFMKDVVTGLATITESVQVIGEAVEAQGKVIIPAVVARVAFGAGGGSGTGPSDTEGERGEGTGGGGGGGAVLTPVFLVVDEQGERLHTVPGPLGIASSIIERAKNTVDRIMPRKAGDDSIEDDEELQDLGNDAPGETE